MPASRLVALGVAVLAAVPSLASGADAAAPDALVVEIDSPGAARTHPLTERVRLTLPGAREPVDVHVCEQWECHLTRVHRVGVDGLVVEQHLPVGRVWVSEGGPSPVSGASTRAGRSGSHAVALFGQFGEAAPLAATVVRGMNENGPAGGVTPYEATELLTRQPELALAFAAVVVAPAASLDEALVRSLLRLVEMGGAVVVPRALAALFTQGGSEEPLVADPATTLVELRSRRAVVEGPRALHATVVRRVGAIVLYDEDAITQSSLSDALLAAVPRFHANPRLNVVDPGQTPASNAAGLAVSRVVHPGVLFLPLAVALLLVVVALGHRRRRGAFLTRPFVALALASTAALLIIPRLVDGGGARAEVRTYVSFGDARVALEEGAVAERPPASGGIVALTAPIGALPVADVRGVVLSGPRTLDVSDAGRTLRFEVHGDGAGIAAWTRVVSLPGGLHVASDDGWPAAVEQLVVENRLPFTLLSLAAIGHDGSRFRAPALAPGLKTSEWKYDEAPWDEALDDEHDDPRALAERRLFEGMRQRCQSWGLRDSVVSCVIGVGVAPDGALVGVQVLSP